MNKEDEIYMTIFEDQKLTQADLENEFAANHLSLSPEESNSFWQLHQLLAERNEEGDLTRVRGERNLVLKHYIDGALAAKLIKFQPQGLTMDLGTGAGFPGLPLAILRPQWSLLLAEPRGRRLAFMEEMVVRLGLTNVEFYPHKVGPRFNCEIENFITRDFESVGASLMRAAQIIPPGGRVYLMKGPGVDFEIREAQKEVLEWNYFELEDDQTYEFDQGRIKRRLLTWRKKMDSPRPAPPPPWPVVEIASQENPRYKSWLKSFSGRGLKKSGQTIISGAKFIREILANYPEQVAGLIATRLSDVEPFSPGASTTVHLVRPELFSALDTFGAGSPLLILNIPEAPVWDGCLNSKLTVFLPFQDPSNLGAAIRTATALEAQVVLLKDAANPWHPKSLRAAGPALLSADLFSGPTLAELAQLELPGLYALSPVGENLLSPALSLPDSLGFVFGPEGPGLDELWAKGQRLSIPMNPKVESLNASAALAMTLGIIKARSF